MNDQVFVTTNQRKRQLWRRKSSNTTDVNGKQDLNSSIPSKVSLQTQHKMREKNSLNDSQVESSLNSQHIKHEINSCFNPSLLTGVVHKPWNKNNSNVNTSQISPLSLQQNFQFNTLGNSFLKPETSFATGSGLLLPTQFHPLPPQTMLHQPHTNFFANNNCFNQQIQPFPYVNQFPPTGFNTQVTTNSNLNSCTIAPFTSMHMNPQSFGPVKFSKLPTIPGSTSQSMITSVPQVTQPPTQSEQSEDKMTIETSSQNAENTIENVSTKDLQNKHILNNDLQTNNLPANVPSSSQTSEQTEILINKPIIIPNTQIVENVETDENTNENDTNKENESKLHIDNTIATKTKSQTSKKVKKSSKSKTIVHKKTLETTSCGFRQPLMEKSNVRNIQNVSTPTTKELNSKQTSKSMQTKSKISNNKALFPKPFNQIVAEREAISNTMVDGCLATTNHLHCINVINNEFTKVNALNKSILKQQRAEDRRLQLRAERETRFKIIAARNKKMQDKLKKDRKEKIQKQKQRLNCKLMEAKSRYEEKLNEKKRKVKEKNHRIKVAAKAKQRK